MGWLNLGKTTEKCKLTKNCNIHENFEKTCETTGNFRKNSEKFCKFIRIKNEKFYKIWRICEEIVWNFGKRLVQF